MGNYYGSDLNRFIGENCPRTFTNINIDCFQLRWEDRIVRFMEHKHGNENLQDQQYKALKLLGVALQQLIFKDWQFKVQIVRGDEPFNKISVTDLGTNTTEIIEGRENVIDWLSFQTNHNPEDEDRGKQKRLL